MIEHGRIMSLAHCLPQVEFPKQSDRDHFITLLVGSAFDSHKLDIVDLLLALKDFDLLLEKRGFSVWTSRPCGLEDAKLLISRHPRHATYLAPLYTEFLHDACDVEDAMFFIELRRHCCQVSAGSDDPVTFDPTGILTILLKKQLRDEEMVLVVKHLLDLEAQVLQMHLHLRGHMKQTRQLLLRYHAWQQEGEIKEPETD
jgi:hypothetical protein